MKSQFIQSYYIQIVSLISLGASNFVLPIILDSAMFGILSYTMSITYLSVLIIDEGINLKIAKGSLCLSLFLYKLAVPFLVLFGIYILSELNAKQFSVLALQRTNRLFASDIV